MRSLKIVWFSVVLAGTLAVSATPAVAREAQSGVGDEATINAHAMDLYARIRAAERAEAISRPQADRLSRTLAKVVRSAKSDLRRPPHFISAAENVSYSRTLASVDAALKNVKQ